MASTRYEIKITYGMRRASMPDHTRIIAEIGCSDWEGTRTCGCYIHNTALKTWGVEQLAFEISHRLYKDYTDYYGEPENA